MGKLSIIVVNFNSGSHLHRLIGPIINNPKIEKIVVVDNGSTDSSIKSLRSRIKSPKLSVIENTYNLGFSRAANLGVSSTNTEYILLLNPDTIISSASIDKLILESERNRDAVVAPKLMGTAGKPQSSCFRKQTLMNAIKEYWLGKKYSYSKYTPQTRSTQRVWCAVAAVWMMPRSVWDRLGGFDEKYFLYFEDLDFCRKAEKSGVKILYAGHIRVKHLHGLSAASNPDSQKELHNSSLLYHGVLRKLLIDFVIITSRAFTSRPSFKRIFIIYALWIIFSNIIASLGYFLLESRLTPLDFINEYWRSNYLIWSKANFDGEHYLSIAKFGYGIRNSFPQHAFFPLFPALISLLTKITKDVFLSGVIISQISTFVFLYYLSKWLSLLKINNRPRIILSTLLFPGAYFLQSIYTESLFLALTAYTLYESERANYLPAAIAAGLATATRINGLALVAFLILSMFRSKLSFNRLITFSSISFSGILAYMVYLKNTTGSAFSFYLAQSSWGKSSLTSPFSTFSRYKAALTTEFVLDLTHAVVAIEVAVVLYMLYLLYLAIQSSMKTSLIVYSSLILAVPILTGSLGSMPRFALLAFPLLTLTGKFSRTKYGATILISTLIFIFGTILFVRGYWYA